MKLYNVKHIVSVEGLEFSASHFIIGHPKCGRLHGHNYIVNVSLEGFLNETTGMILDFTEVKSRVKNCIDKFDHKVLIPYESIDNVKYVHTNMEFSIIYKENTKIYSLPIEDIVVLREYHVTAEILSRHIAERLYEQFSAWSCTVTVTIYETTKSSATFIAKSDDKLRVYCDKCGKYLKTFNRGDISIYVDYMFVCADCELHYERGEKVYVVQDEDV